MIDEGAPRSVCKDQSFGVQKTTLYKLNKLHFLYVILIQLSPVARFQFMLILFYY